MYQLVKRHQKQSAEEEETHEQLAQVRLHVSPRIHLHHVLLWLHLYHVLPRLHLYHVLLWLHLYHVLPRLHMYHVLLWLHLYHVLPRLHLYHVLLDYFCVHFGQLLLLVNIYLLSTL